MKRKKNNKINTNGKSYPLHDSPFYKLRSKKVLFSLLKTDKEKIAHLKSDQGYNTFTQKSNKKTREIEHPVDALDIAHTKIASLLCRVTTPTYVHSGVKGRTHVTNAKEHLGKKRVLTTDIKSFYPSTTRQHVFKLFFNTFKCSPDVADILADICTFQGHVPTGSRLSMPIALWANINMFDELNVVSRKHDITMTVYVDDITFSGNLLNGRFKSLVKKIISRYDHVMHPKKTVLYKDDEIKVITGVVLDQDGIKIKNSQHKLIYQDIEQWKLFKGLAALPPESLNSRLMGRLHALSVINPRLKDKARSIKNCM
ncbi:DNA polymerase [Photobacterium gaetbulicola]|uniref:DNA polymerase n=1 Tax=Photobacterium gaetbulicola TaxID=1295392 RepID=A0A0B9H6G7_9GAMM|nr:reverse transcriptase family protein [Photobacterium gaetbulicola]KHT64487.1 DNA polymerase [Photobacterium gaetbulicola]